MDVKRYSPAITSSATLKKKGILFFSLTIFLTLIIFSGVIYTLNSKAGKDSAAPLVQETYLILGCPFLLLLGTLLVGMIYYQRNIIKPLAKINYGITRMTEGNLDKPLHIERGDEIGEVGVRINDLAMNLQEVLLYLWNHTQQSSRQLDRIAALINQLPDSSRIQQDVQHLYLDNEELQTMVQSFRFFEVKLEQEKMISGSTMDNPDDK